MSRARPDVVIMDLRMKQMSGIEAIRLLHAAQGPPALALTTFDDDELLSGALRAGAAGFILKDSPAEELVRAVHAVARGEAYLDPAVTSRVLNAYRRAPAAVSGMPRTNSPHGNWMCWHSSPPGQPTPKSLNNS